MSKNKTAIAFALFLMFAMTFSLVALPSANAHTPAWKIQLLAFINVAPNPVGVGQQVSVGFWLNEPPPTASGPLGDRYENMKVIVTHPDGTTETLGPFTSDDTGGSHTYYTPDKTGTYKFQMEYPGQTLTGGSVPSASYNPDFINDTILPAESDVVTLTVQEEPNPSVPSAPLPTSYWQTPINAMNVHNWYAIGGPYLSLATGYGPAKGGANYNLTTNYNPYSTAPTTSHILWTRPAAFGGVIGGDAGGTTTYGNYYSTAQYERKYCPIIINGYLYYTEFPGSSTNPTANICVDLYTGQTVWTDDATNYGGGNPQQTALTASGLVTPLLCGQVLDYVSPNQYGGIAYLWTTGTPVGINSRGTTLNMFDAMTGKYILSVVNGTNMQLTVDDGGNLIGYYVNNTAGTQTIDGPINPLTGPTRVQVTTPPGGGLIEVWNSTQCIEANNWFGSAQGWMWRPPQNGVIDFSLGITSAWQLPVNSPPGTYPNRFELFGVDSSVAVVDALNNAGLVHYFTVGSGFFAGYDIKTGQQLWIHNETFTPYAAVNLDNYNNIGEGAFVTIEKETGITTAFSVTTGNQVWQTTLKGFNGADINPYDTVGGIKGMIAGKNIYIFGFGGDIWSVDMHNGTVNWYTNTTAIHSAYEGSTPYGVWPIWVQTGIGGGGGLIFLEEGHEYSPPLFLGAQLLALNATNGQLVWRIDSFDVNSNPALAYGIMTSLNAYDNLIYAYGKGPSATTVTAFDVGVTTATPVTVRGTVTDVSAGSQQEAVAANFPNGLPCVSDESMSSWMEYVYMQQPKPTNATGVKVTISVLDPNNNCYDVATTTSDASGFYSAVFTPQVPGKYTVIATFTGSGSYYGSYAETAINVAEAPAATAPPTAPPASLADIYILPMSIVLLIAIIVVGAVLVLMLRRR